ncbi:hypothetical protein DKX38_009814 [Salix brachista]|uniref:Uncharacterized protein n=1 Tax=Salix brachista TaxID=2182728 RepID=A0A5N5MDZ7_9ROSI|nr:hypothetical protein DKX38_009814 [Salix brachista]
MYARKGYELVKDLANGEKGQLQPFNEDLFNQVVDQCTQHYLELQALISYGNRKMQEESVDVRETRNSDHYGALIHHLSLIRNKRCLMAYVHNRAEVIQNFAWKVGLELLELPEEIQEKLSPSEKNYFGKHSSALQSYMAEVGIDLNVGPWTDHISVTERWVIMYHYAMVALADEEGYKAYDSISRETRVYDPKSKMEQEFANWICLTKDMVPPKDPYIKVRVLDDMGEGILLSDKTANLARHSMHFLKRTDAEQYIARGLMEELTG